MENNKKLYSGEIYDEKYYYPGGDIIKHIAEILAHCGKDSSKIVSCNNTTMPENKCAICGVKDEYANFSQKHNAIVCWECYGK